MVKKMRILYLFSNLDNFVFYIFFFMKKDYKVGKDMIY